MKTNLQKNIYILNATLKIKALTFGYNMSTENFKLSSSVPKPKFKTKENPNYYINLF